MTTAAGARPRARRREAGGDRLGRAALELHRAAIHRVPPAHRGRARAAHPLVGAAALLTDGGLLSDERAEDRARQWLVANGHRIGGTSLIVALVSPPPRIVRSLVVSCS